MKAKGWQSTGQERDRTMEFEVATVASLGRHHMLLFVTWWSSFISDIQATIIVDDRGITNLGHHKRGSHRQLQCRWLCSPPAAKDLPEIFRTPSGSTVRGLLDRQHCHLTICRLVEFVKSEANPNNNLMMRRAGLSEGSWYLKDIDGFTFSYCPEVRYPIHCIVYRESYKFITSYATVRVPQIYTFGKPRISDLMRCNNLYNKMKQNCYGEDPTK